MSKSNSLFRIEFNNGIKFDIKKDFNIKKELDIEK